MWNEPVVNRVTWACVAMLVTLPVNAGNNTLVRPPGSGNSFTLPLSSNKYRETAAV
jgi:hypothetical protein